MPQDKGLLHLTTYITKEFYLKIESYRMSQRIVTYKTFIGNLGLGLIVFWQKEIMDTVHVILGKVMFRL